MRALVVFHGRGAGFARLLLPGFRHCFCCVLDEGGYWVRVDGLAGRPLLRVEAGADFDLAGFYRNHGFTVLELDGAGRKPRWPLVARSCVGSVKATIGIRSWAVTPRQLYLSLTNRRN